MKDLWSDLERAQQAVREITGIPPEYMARDSKASTLAELQEKFRAFAQKVNKCRLAQK